ncbi:MAG: hypothetical protein FJY97_17440 [candidate division Zixibacteria bacterium]|nr:hypothetical protein [candidate division Zixibacteria bacterium]
MRIDFSDIRLLYLREIRSALRERNIVLNVLIMPIFLYPAILWLIYSAIAFVAGQTEGFTSRVVIRGETASVEAKRPPYRRWSRKSAKTEAWKSSLRRIRKPRFARGVSIL